MPKVAIFGATGFIGCNLVHFLKERGYWVRGVDIKEVPFRESKYGVADEIYICDLRDRENVDWALEGISYVFHLASDMGGVGYFSKYNYEPFINNMTMDMNVLKACEKAKVKRLFYSSSACVYPIHLSAKEGKPTLLSEDMIIPANSDQMYGWEKLMMLKLCEEAPFDARVGIFDTIYGPYQEFEGERVKFPCAIAKKALDARKTDKIEIWGNGKQLRVFNYIDDALEQIYRIMFEKYKGPVNVCSSKLVSIQECADICEV